MNDIDNNEQDIDNEQDEGDDYEQARVPLYERTVGTSVALVQEASSFLGIYLRERPWFLVPAAVPAIAAIICAAYVFVWCVVQSDEQVIRRLKTRLGQAVVLEDLERRRICVLTLLQKSPEDPECRFAYALLLRDDGETRASQVMIEQLAPADDVGFGPAHRLLAEEALALLRDAETDREALLQVAIHHMESARLTDNAPWDYQLGKLYVETGDLLLAELRLRRAARAGYGPAQMVVSRFERRQGDLAEADRLVKAAQQGLESYVLEHPDDLDARLAWAECLVELRDWPALAQAFSVLSHESEAEHYRNQLGRLYLTASQKQPTATATMRAATVQYAFRAFQLLEDPTPAAWRLVELTRSRFMVPSEYLEAARQWQQQASRDQVADATWLQLAAFLAEAVGDVEAAERDFCEAVKAEPKVISELAAFYRRQGSTEKLLETSGQVIEHFEPLHRERPQDVAIGIALATAYADHLRWEDARTVLLSLEDNDRVSSLLADLCIRQYDSCTIDIEQRELALAGAQPDASDAYREAAIHRCELLRQALLAVPDFPPAADRLTNELLGESTTGGEPVQQFLIAMLANGEQPLAIHHLLGIQATNRCEWPAAVRHFEQAHRLRSDDPLIMNNLAYALLRNQASQESLRRGKDLIDRALQVIPRHPELLATRGELLARLGDDVGAAADLESALQALPGARPELHRELAACYQRLGMESLCREHMQKARVTEATP